MDELVERIKVAMLKNLSDQGFDTTEAADGFCLIDHTIDLSAFARACLSEIEAAGYVCVPVEPTDAMLAATEGLDIYWDYHADGSPGDPSDVWRVMLSASRKV